MRPFYQNCVNWPAADVHAEGGLCDMIAEARDITRRTFLKHVDRESLAEVEASLGYETHPARGLTMAADWHVSYHVSRVHHDKVYFFKHSAIEYVFKYQKAEAVDVETNASASIVGITPMTDTARTWIAENVNAESWQWLGPTLHIDARYAGELIEGMQEAGLTVR